MANRNLYLLHYAHEHIPFRWPEFLALASKHNCKFSLISDKEHIQTRPYILIDLEDDQEEEIRLIKTARDSYLLKDLYELWAQSKTSIDDLATQASGSRRLEKFLASTANKLHQSFKINCESFGAKISQPTKVDMISKMHFVKSFECPLNLSNATQTFSIFEMNDKQQVIQNNSLPCDHQNSVITTREYYFGRHLTKSSRTLVDRFSLKRRNFIANTSMDPLLSLVASNNGQVRPNDLVFDPFVGSGSLLVAAAHMGAYVLGADIDWMLLHGKSKPSKKGMAKRAEGENVRANLSQYDLQNRYLDVLVSDISRNPLNDKFQLDAIIADPPYGIRESSERIGRRQRDYDRPKAVDDERVRYPSKINYDVQDLIADLLTFAAHHLRLRRRLVYFLPVTIKDPSDKFENYLPTQSSLELISYCEQQLTRKTYRLMITMEKIKEFEIDLDRVSLPQALTTMDFRGTYFSVSGEGKVKLDDQDD